jgi:signal transduction histidine kinase
VDAVDLCRSWGWAVGAMAALLLLGTVLLLRNRRRLAVAQELQRTQSFERERQARQLHDTLLQGMHGLILRFQAVHERLPAGDPASGGMDAALRRADEVLNAARDRVLALRRRDEAGSRLARVLDEAARELAGDDGAQFSLRVEGPARELQAAVHDELRHILGEALLNAFRHARAHHIVLTLDHGRRAFRASVVDDGVGMAPALLRQGRTGHWGLAGMRERAECIGAALTLHSRAGEGTTVMVRLPARLAYLSQ